MTKLFDSFCSFGNRAGFKFPRLGDVKTVTELVKEMEHFGIGKALVMPPPPKSYHAGNQDHLYNDLVKENNIFLRLPLLPKHGKSFSGYPELELDRNYLIDNKIKAVSLHPLRDKFPLSDWVLGDLLKELNKMKMVTVLNIAEISPHTYSPFADRMVDLVGGNNNAGNYYWDKVHELACKYPDIPFVLARLTGDSGRYRTMINQILEKHDNIYIELSHNHCLDAIEDLVSGDKIEKILFGTNLPIQDPGQAVAQLNYADISQKDRERIGSGNLERIIGEEEI